MVKDVLKEKWGAFVGDDWGKLNLGQPTSKGIEEDFLSILFLN